MNSPLRTLRVDSVQNTESPGKYQYFPGNHVQYQNEYTEQLIHINITAQNETSEYETMQKTRL